MFHVCYGIVSLIFSLSLWLCFFLLFHDEMFALIYRRIEKKSVFGVCLYFVLSFVEPTWFKLLVSVYTFLDTYKHITKIDYVNLVDGVVFIIFHFGVFHHRDNNKRASSKHRRIIWHLTFFSLTLVGIFIIWRDQSCDTVKSATIIKQMTSTDRTNDSIAVIFQFPLARHKQMLGLCLYAMKNKSIKANYFFCRLLELQRFMLWPIYRYVHNIYSSPWIIWCLQITSTNRLSFERDFQENRNNNASIRHHIIHSIFFSSFYRLTADVFLVVLSTKHIVIVFPCQEKIERKIHSEWKKEGKRFIHQFREHEVTRHSQCYAVP